MDRLPFVPPRSADPQLPERIVDTAARLLAMEGGVSARRLARELGTSTMVVYTHFGGMDELSRQVMRRGFGEFGTELDRGAVTDDAVADWMTYLWNYRRFALREPHLYAVMFGPGLAAFRLGDPADLEAARSTFVSLLRRIHACVNAADGRSTTSSPLARLSGPACTATRRSSTPGSSVRSAAIRCARTVRSSPGCRSASATTPQPQLARSRGPDGGPSEQTEPRERQRDQDCRDHIRRP